MRKAIVKQDKEVGILYGRSIGFTIAWNSMRPPSRQGGRPSALIPRPPAGLQRDLRTPSSRWFVDEVAKKT